MPTKSDIRDGESITLVAEIDYFQRFEDDGNMMLYLIDEEGNELKLKIWDEEVSNYTDVEFEDGVEYRFEDAEGDVFDGEAMLGSNRGEMEITRVSEADTEAEAVGDNSSSSSSQPDQMTPEGDPGGVLAFDIETLSTVPESELDLDDPTHIELLCIGVGYAPTVDQSPAVDVLFRVGRDTASEESLLERFVDYVVARNPAQIVVYHGLDFDVKHVQARAKLVGGGTELHERVQSVFAEREVRNVSPPGSLESNADVPETFWDIYQHSLDPASWRADHPNYSENPADPVVTNVDIPHFGAAYLERQDESGTEVETRALRELLRRYTAADIRPLFELAD